MNKLTSPDGVIQYLADSFALADVVCMSWQDKASGFSLFKGRLGTEQLFIKWGGRQGNCLNDYTYTRKLYHMDPDCFLRPYFCVNEGDIQCFGIAFYEGRTLKTALTDGSLSAEETRRVIEFLPRAARTLVEANCVHRDIKPDNIAILNDGSIKLFDFEYAVDADNYKEREELLRFPHLLSTLGVKSECGVSLGIGKFIWDDMVIFKRILKRLGKAEGYAQAERFFQSREGKRVIRFPHRRRLILKFRAIEFLSSFMPLKPWRDKVRSLKRRAHC